MIFTEKNDPKTAIQIRYNLRRNQKESWLTTPACWRLVTEKTQTDDFAIETVADDLFMLHNNMGQRQYGCIFVAMLNI